MKAEELYRSGHLAEAIAEQTAAVKAAPTDADRRYFLFGLLAFTGDWDRAGRQLDALGLEDEAVRAGGLVYHQLLDAERDRQAVWREGRRPLTPPDPPEHLERRVELLGALGGDAPDAAGTALAAAEAAAPSLAGSINGGDLHGLRDQDDVLGSVLEVFAGGRCLWLPLEHLRRLETQPPRHLLDLLWLPAQIEDADGTEARVHLPVLYAGSAAADEDELRLGRRTDWRDAGAEIFCGVGQRVLAYADGDETLQGLGILELRSLAIDAA